MAAAELKRDASVEVAQDKTHTQAQSVTVQPTGDLVGTWHEMAQAFNLKAFAGQLVRQSELVELSATELVLRCEKASLATDETALKTLRAALKNYFDARGQAVPKLVIHIAKAGEIRHSPQKVIAQQKEDSLAQARAALQQHPSIQAIVRTFDGMILPNSIQPN